MEIGIGLDATLRLSWREMDELAREAVELGYRSAWTPASSIGRDSFHLCARWHAASGISSGIAVVPMPTWTAVQLATQAATVGEMTDGHFIAGIGTWALHEEATRHQFGMPEVSPVQMSREFLLALRGLLAGETVTVDGKAVTLRGVALSFRPPRVPVYLAALGPRMLRLAGELADGVLPNWASPESIAWCRERVAEGARAVGRDPADIPIVQYIRVCVDDDPAVARRAFARGVLSYAMARPGASKSHGYRAHFGRMGFDDVLNELEARRDAGASADDLADASPDEMLRAVGYWGRADGAPARFRELARGLDTAIVRVVPARPGVDAVRQTMRALRPELTGP